MCVCERACVFEALDLHNLGPLYTNNFDTRAMHLAWCSDFAINTVSLRMKVLALGLWGVGARVRGLDSGFSAQWQ